MYSVNVVEIAIASDLRSTCLLYLTLVTLGSRCRIMVVLAPHDPEVVGLKFTGCWTFTEFGLKSP